MTEKHATCKTPRGRDAKDHSSTGGILPPDASARPGRRTVEAHTKSNCTAAGASADLCGKAPIGVTLERELTDAAHSSEQTCEYDWKNPYN